MIRKIYKASGSTKKKEENTNGQTQTTQTTQTDAQVNAQVGGQVASTAIDAAGKIGTAALSKVNPLGWVDSLISGVAGIFTGAFSMLGSLGTTRNNNSAQTQQMYWLTARDGNDERETNNGFYTIIGLAIVALTVYLIVKSVKSK